MHRVIEMEEEKEVANEKGNKYSGHWCGSNQDGSFEKLWADQIEVDWEKEKSQNEGKNETCSNEDLIGSRTYKFEVRKENEEKKDE